MRPFKKYKVARRLGAPIFEKTQTEKFVLRESRRGKPKMAKHARTFTDFGRQLIEKQKVRFSYGISERQFRRYVDGAAEARGSAPAFLYTSLEQRLDNTVYRLGIASTRRAARQFVSHGHIFVNGKRVKIPSYSVKKGDTITVRKESQSLRVFENLGEKLEKYNQPQWLSFNPKSLEGSVIGLPAHGESGEIFNLSSVIEFYSR